jgi:hypothetical protein
MNPVCPARESDIETIVDQKARRRPACDAKQIVTERDERRGVEIALAKLNQIDPCRNRMARLLEKAAPRRLQRRTRRQPAPVGDQTQAHLSSLR